MSTLRERKARKLAEIEARLLAVTWAAMGEWLTTARAAVQSSTTLTAAADLPPSAESVLAAAGDWRALVVRDIVPAIDQVLGEVYAEHLQTEGVVSARSWQENHLAGVPNRVVNLPDAAFDALRDELQDGIDAGASIPELRDRMATVLSTQVGGTENRWLQRATVIARTEATTAYAGGQVDAWRARDEVTGQATDKFWIATMDPRTRDAHYAADGQRVPVGEQFIVDGERLDAPGDAKASAANRIHCRCSVGEVPAGDPLPVIDGDRQLDPASAGEVRVRQEAGQRRASEARPGAMAAADSLDGAGHGDVALTALPKVKQTAKQRAQLAGYGSQEWTDVNRALRAGDELAADLQPLVEAADAVLEQAVVTQAMHVYRSVDVDGEQLAGRGVVDRGFLDVTTQAELAAGGAAVLDVLVGAGRRALRMDVQPGATDTGQVLLPRATALAVRADRVLPATVDGAAYRELFGREPLPVGEYGDLVDEVLAQFVTAKAIKPAEARRLAAGEDDAKLLHLIKVAARAQGEARAAKLAALAADVESQPEAIAEGVQRRVRVLSAEAVDQLPPDTELVDLQTPGLAEPGSTDRAVTAAAGGSTQMPKTWEGVLAPIGANSGDRRRFKTGGLFTIRPLPLPLLFQETTADGHDTATVVGRILTVEQRGDHFYGTGDYLEGPEFAVAVGKASALAAQGMGHVSVDLADVVAEVTDANGEPLDEDAMFEMWESQGPAAESSLYEQFAEATLIGATQVAKPAFAEAIIRTSGGEALVADDVDADTAAAVGDPAAPASSGAPFAVGDAVIVSVDAFDDPTERDEIRGTVTVVDEEAGTVTVQPEDPEAETITAPFADVRTSAVPVEDDEAAPTQIVVNVSAGPTAAADVVAEAAAIVERAAAQLQSLAASAAPEQLFRPDAELFADPSLTGPTPMTIGPRLADGSRRVFGHLAAWGQCHVGFSRCITPPDEASFDFFHIGEVELEDGRYLAVGNLTLGGRHADVKMAYADAIRHYDDSGSGVAMVRAYKDTFGIAVAGVIPPWVTDKQLVEMRRSGLSGDWRRQGAEMRLAGALAVNSGGFPMPRHAVDGRGRQIGLVAAGMVPQSLATEETYEQTARRVFAEETQKVARRVEIAALVASANAPVVEANRAALAALVAAASPEADQARRNALAELAATVAG